VINEMDDAEDHPVRLRNETMHGFCGVMEALPGQVRHLWCLEGLIEGEIALP
jgi:hypothetical protein